MITLANAEITYYDSLNNGGDCIMSNVRQYLIDKCEKNGDVMWRSRNVKVPKQVNNSVCGIHVCMLATLLTKEWDLHLSEDTCPSFRMHIAQLILSCSDRFR
jgi:Ulp1 family protease